jgi:hypothetical protein
VFARHRRGSIAIGALVLFLILGALRDGAPTHHAERAVLAVWFWLALFASDAIVTSWSALSAPGRAAAIALTGLAVAPAAGILRPWYAHRDSFIDRSNEIAIGSDVRERAQPSDRILIDTSDYAFWAVIAGFGDPNRARPFDDRDPRKPRAADPFASDDALRARIRDENARWIVVGQPRLERARSLGSVETERGPLSLVRVAD